MQNKQPRYSEVVTREREFLSIFIGRPIKSLSVSAIQWIQSSAAGAGLDQLGLVLERTQDGVEVVSDFVTELGGNDHTLVALPDGFFFGCEVPPALVHEAFNPVTQEA